MMPRFVPLPPVRPKRRFGASAPAPPLASLAAHWSATPGSRADMASPARLEALTGLRFFAALAVLFYHIPFVLPAAVGYPVLPDGALGVNFFFVLSGFILAHAYSGSASRPDPFPTLDFFRKRFARIYPLHALTFVVWAVLFFPAWGNIYTDKINGGIANILLLQAFFSGPLFNLGFNAVSWSISVEAFFYVVFPWLIVGRRAPIIFLFYVVLFLAMPTRITAGLEQTFPSFFYFNPMARLMEFVAGIALYQLCAKLSFLRLEVGVIAGTSIQAAAVALVIVASLATAPLPMHMRNLALVLPFGVVILAFLRDGHLSRLMASRPVVLLGEASFALYMIHHMTMRAIDPILAAAMPASLALLVAALVCVALSVALHVAFEQPFRQWLR